MSDSEVASLRELIAERENRRKVTKFLKEKAKAIGFWAAIAAGIAGGAKTLIDTIIGKH
jgi:hypothetical protein